MSRGMVSLLHYIVCMLGCLCTYLVILTASQFTRFVIAPIGEDKTWWVFRLRILNPFPYLVVQSLQDSHCAKGPKLAQLSSHGAPICSSPLNAHDIKSWVRGLQKELFDKFHGGSKAPIAKLITGNNPVNESSIVAVLTKCHIHPDIDNFGQFVTRIILKHREFTSGCHILRYKSCYGCVKGDIQ